MVGFIPDSDLRILYEHSLALVFPSFLEVCGDAALRCRADDVDQIMRHMQALHSDAALRARLSAAGKERARLFTWGATARHLLDHCLALQAKEAA